LSGIISAALSGTFGAGTGFGFTLATVLAGLDLGAAFGGGGGGVFLRLAGSCAFLAVLAFEPSVKFEIGTVCTISIATIGCSSGSLRLIDGKPTANNTAIAICSTIEIMTGRDVI
jgi:hypothetical protein